MKRSILLVSVLVLAAACGDNKKTAPDGGGNTGDSGSSDGAPAAPHAVVVAGDFTAGHPGVMAALDVKTQTVKMDAAPAGAVGDDPVVRKLGHELFIVNRADGNNVTILDATTHALVEQIGTGAGSNPQDVAIKGDKLYVPVYGGSGVAVLTRGSSTVDMIDLSADDPDRKPNCVSNVLVGDLLYVACELLNDNTFSPRGLGKVYVVDTANGNAIAHTLTLTTKNPMGLFETAPAGDLLIPTADFGNNGAGCIEKVTTGATPAAAGCVVNNTQLSGYVNRLDFDGTTMLLAVSALDFTHANLQGYDMQTSSLWSMPLTPAAEVIGDVVACPDGTIVAADTAMGTAGLRVFKNDAEVTTAALPVGLSPKSAHGLVCY